MKKTSAADFGSCIFAAMTPAALARLRLAAWLDRKAPADRDRWHAPRPSPADPAAVREIVLLGQPEPGK